MTRIRIGTRGSKLALAQVDLAVAAIRAAHPHVTVDVVTLETTGDKTQKSNIALQKIGGKGLFADALNAAMDRGEVDLIVHSMKDLPSIRPAKYAVPAMLERADARDVFLSRLPGVGHWADLPRGAVIGTSSPRRASMVLHRRPDLKPVIFRGNVDTRLQKLRDGVDDVAATFLARAGLERLNLHTFDNLSHSVLDVAEFLPAAGQGAIGLEVMADNTHLIALLKHIGCARTHACVTAERACLAVVDGDCKTSIGAYAIIDGGTLWLRTEIYSEDGRYIKKAESRAPYNDATDAAQLGLRVGRMLLDNMTAAERDLFMVCRPAV